MMRVYKVWTNKRDYERVFNKRPTVREYEFLLVTKNRALFSAIVVHRFYDRVMLSREVDSMSAADQAAVNGISIAELEALILPLLFGDDLRLTVDEDSLVCKVVVLLAEKISSCLMQEYELDNFEPGTFLAIYDDVCIESVKDSIFVSGFGSYEPTESSILAKQIGSLQ